MQTIPYIDLNNINLDWLLQNMHKIVAEWAAYQVSMGNKFDSLEAAYTALQTWINEYFSRLNVQTEINNKLDAMAAGGQLLSIIKPTVQDTTTGWLDTHITNAQYPLDDTLTQQGAASDSKAVGDRFLHDEETGMNWKAQLVTGDDLNSLYLPGWYVLKYADTITNAPESVSNKHRLVLIFTTSTPQAGAFKHMMYYNKEDGTVWFRIMNEGAWESWTMGFPGLLSTSLTETNKAAQAKKVGDELTDLRLDAMTWKAEIAGSADLNDLYEPGWYIIQSAATPTNAPENVSGKHRYLLIFTTSSPGATAFKHMLYVNREDNTVYIRMMSGGTWDSWTAPMVDQIYNSKEALLWHSRALSALYNLDLDAVTLPGWYNITTGSTLTGTIPPGEAASGGRRQLWVTSTPDGTQRFMIYYNYESGLIAWRIFYGSSWKSWYVIKYADKIEKQNFKTPDYFQQRVEFAHRGVYLNQQAPQNTLPAFRLAVSQGYNGIEADVQITSDNVPVIIHDRNIAITARTPEGQTITDPTYIDQITYAQTQEYDFGIRISAAFAGTKLMTLEEFLTFCQRTGTVPELHLKETITNAKLEYVDQTLIRSGMRYKAFLFTGDKTVLRAMATYFDHCFIGLMAASNAFGSDIPGLFDAISINGNQPCVCGGRVFMQDADMAATMQGLVDKGVIHIFVYANTDHIDETPDWCYMYLVNPADAQTPYFHPVTLLYNQEMGIVQ